MDRAVLHALRVGALLAVLDSELASTLAVAEGAVAGVGGLAPVIVIPHTHAGDVLAHAAVVLQRAHHLAALAARATGAVGDDHLGGRGAQLDAAGCDGLLGDAPAGQRAADDQTRNAAAGHGQHVAAGDAFLAVCRNAVVRGSAVSNIGIRHNMFPPRKLV